MYPEMSKAAPSVRSVFHPISAALVVCSLAAAPQPSGEPTPDAGALYSKMVLAMNAQASPHAVAYDETVTPHGLGLRIIDAGGKAAVHVVFSSDPTVRVFHVEQHQAQITADVVDTTSGQHYSADQLFWSATWVTVPSPSATQPTVLSAVRTKMISDLTSASIGDYTLSYVGIADVNGVPAFHVHMAAVKDATAHPLTDVFIDEQSYLLRRAVAAFTDNSVTNVTGQVTLSFDRVAGFWLATSGEVDATVRAYFKTVSGSATFAASNVTFAAQ
jgi:hypothetical protein